MKHPTESQLNQYLDGELEAGTLQAVEAHLTGCAACRRALASLETVVSALAGLPEEALERDLAPSILAGLPRPRLALGWKLILAAQAGFAVGLITLIVTNLRLRVDIPLLEMFLSLSLPVLEFPTIQLPALALPVIALQPSTAQLAFLAASALLLWGVGNAVLLKNGNRVQK